MTGVGDGATYSASEWGTAGLPPSVVARPEIVLEGLFDKRAEVEEGGTVDEWRELKFLYKPGQLDKAPVWAAPYQPRLDWQMWFAALGSYQDNPWFISLLDRVMEGEEVVAGLMDESEDSLKGMKAIRATLWDYDFTRTENEWNGRIPGVEMEEASGGENWWSRKNGREYTPVLEKGNASVKEFLRAHGYEGSTEGGGEGGGGGGLEAWLGEFRENGGIWSPIIAIFLGAAIVKASKRGWIPKWLSKRRLAKMAARGGGAEGGGDGGEGSGKNNATTTTKTKKEKMKEE